MHLIPSHLGLINVNLELATELGGATLKQSKTNFLKVHKRLSDGLQQISNEKYDLVLMDCPPNFNITTKTAIVASDYILIPAKPDYLSTLGIDYLINNLNTLISDYNEYATLNVDDIELNKNSIDPKSRDRINKELAKDIPRLMDHLFGAGEWFYDESEKLYIAKDKNYSGTGFGFIAVQPDGTFFTGVRPDSVMQ